MPPVFPLLLAVILIPLGAVLAARQVIFWRSLAADEKVEEQKKLPMSERREVFRRAFGATGLDDDWLRFLEQTAYRESKFNPRAHNKSIGERLASKRLVYRESKSKPGTYPNVKMLNAAGQEPADWVFGSKGWFQFLGPVVAIEGWRLRFPERMTNPDMAFERGVAVAAAVDYIHDLTQRPNFQGSWASLNIGWGNPSKMGNAAAIKRSAKKLEDRAAKLGWSRGWAMEHVTSVGGERSQEQLATLAKAIQFASGGG